MGEKLVRPAQNVPLFVHPSWSWISPHRMRRHQSNYQQVNPGTGGAAGLDGFYGLRWYLSDLVARAPANERPSSLVLAMLVRGSTPGHVPLYAAGGLQQSMGFVGCSSEQLAMSPSVYHSFWEAAG